MGKASGGNGTKKKKRQSPSVERQFALALVRIVECVCAVEALGAQSIAGDSTPEYEKALDNRKFAIEDARKILDANGYIGLESIALRVATIEKQINEAFVKRDGKEVARLGAELERAKTGRPPIAKTPKPRTPKSDQPKLLTDAAGDLTSGNAAKSQSSAPTGVPNNVGA